ncbi:fructose-6-phosphate aldolase [Cloacibacillus porcorum]|uniref:fructose-6-phosphate aldolase n=1 Tax=Cloacibacillus porcorum TaxID=1197717 RepID=UPI0014594C80|nr:fructose-6-phosphate aldolase [Cloacibacillus porcorum]MCC8183807.1 fructose-6-phosphate aldolase [Cloacibacillus porcorum]MDY5390796.1 fructose-6-phosphate aldolase [Cloacibacillus porcorum]NMF19426.1 fructose-6-phosphate aldolase [Cloacibacillus porcorum]
MKFFLDTANLEDIKTAHSWGVIAGVTTNPTLVSKEGDIDFHTRVREIAETVNGPVSAEAVSLEKSRLIEEAKVLAAIHPQVVVKVPLCPDGLGAVKELTAMGIKTNVTLVFSANQAVLAAAAGATYVSPFVGRLDDIGEDGMKLIYDVVEIFDLYGIETKVIAASLRHPAHVLECAKAGADYATVPFKVLKMLFDHPLTKKGIDQFNADWAKYLANK